MKRSAALWGGGIVISCALVSCVEVTSGRMDGPPVAAPEPGRMTGEKSKVHVYAWNPFDDILDVVTFPVKAVGKGIKKLF